MLNFGGVKFFVKGVNQERAFTTLSKITSIYALKRTGPTSVEFCADIRHEKALIKKVRELCFTVESVKRFGILNQLMLFFKRLGILAALCISLFFLVVFSNFVFDVKIFGLEKITNEQVVNVLHSNNLSGFVFKGKIDTSQVEKIILKEFENISLVSAIIKGNTLIISIKEKVINDDFEDVDSFLPLKSQYNGLITNIKLISGTLRVKVGKIVRYGDILVEPYIIDASGNRRAVKAQAEISARVWYIGKQTHFAKRIETVKTGKSERYVNLTFLGLNLTDNLKKEPSFVNYETVMNTTCISMFNILPIYRQEILYFETKQMQIEESFDAVSENILQKAKEMALNLVEECDIIKKEYFNVATENEITFVEYVIEVEKRVDIL